MHSNKIIGTLIGMGITLASGSPRISQGASSISSISPPIDHPAADDIESQNVAEIVCSAVTLYGAQDTIITSKCDVLAPTCTPCVGCNAPQCEGVIDVVTGPTAQKIIPTPVEKSGPTPI
ncbi:hypothetical protein EJ03DRAFT_351626 [Teratosphaeria nubilosa]|uniref:Uncharacterized protein n=1 Tax=Teratosphaeria nubilosa TaxID=161662 RepID=A0A6G1L7Z1_9PEZI|nr:hypothetical protein EJ03DRAFT_351626 [Teratosphaeria nubilosa]